MLGKNTIKCNMCGKNVKYINGVLEEDFCQVVKAWGYFSKKDLEIHKFNLCENCYDELIRKFKIPIIIEEKSEAL